MSDAITLDIVAIIVLTINLATLFRLFPSKYNRRYVVALMVLLTVAVLAFNVGSAGGLRVIIYLPLLLWMLEGRVFQKVFAFFMTLVFTVSLMSFTNMAATVFAAAGSPEFNIIWLTVSVIAGAAYVFIIFKFGWQTFDRMFENGHMPEWALYSFGGLFSYLMLSISRAAFDNTALRFLFILFILWSFFILCFAIINTHEKSKQANVAEIARSIVTAGRGHYQKMDELYEKLRILRHDYKYHIRAVREMLKSKDFDSAAKYLTDVENQLSAYELQGFCSNTVLNSLIASYAERCRKLDIKLEVKLSIPERLAVPDYEMCIILGNLLENATEACERLGGGFIELASKKTQAQLIIMVKNSFDGKVYCKDGITASRKAIGGIGLKSVRDITSRYDGDLVVEWDNNTFTAYAAVKS